MKPVDEFFFSLREAFRPHEQTGPWTLVALTALVVLGLVAWLVSLRRRRRARERLFTQLVAHRRLTPEDVSLLIRLATAAEVPPIAMATQIEVFERATAMEIETFPRMLVVDDANTLARIRYLRRLLGFETLPEHYPLLTTRELHPGLTIKLADMSTAVLAVTEAFFSLRAPHAPNLATGDIGALTVFHAQEARYALRCELLSSEPAADGAGGAARKLIFAHDESPARFQMRDFVRVPFRGPIRLQTPVTGPAWITATLVDISIGGAALETEAILQPGDGVMASFTLGDAQFSEVKSVVLDSRPGPTGSQRVRVEFENLPKSDEERLSAAVAYLSVKPAAAEPAP
ncbi:MAG TPA: PilZ domain-containing protein [Polyangia bacterium]|jgi:hypothetical protein|nr:PilZ domain-containing protein [Polyangia bacterium]